jgi:GNAT superfamily N-acetyltransferase
MQNVSLRIATAEDIPALLAIINPAFEIEMEFIAGDRTNAEELLVLLEKGQLILAELGGRAAGSIYVEFRGVECYFGMLAVAPEMQGKGLGQLLVTKAEDMALENGCSKMVIRVIDRRTELPPFYEKLGYKITSVEPFPADWETLLPCRMVNMEKDI